MTVYSRLSIFAALLAAQGVQAATDPHSSAEPDQVRVSAIALDLAVSFERKELAGNAELSLDWRKPEVREVHLDTRDLSIEKVEAVDKAGKAHAAKFSLGARDPMRGSPLTISLDAQMPKVRIHYKTSPQASGLQWLEPQQTGGKRHPFMFSQSQAIHARSWVPLQDSPAVRFTYRAHISVPKALRATMSADNDAAHALDGDFRFRMDQPIPSYLLAIAVGDLAVKSTGPRSAVYAEPALVEKAAKEFADTERMIATAEKLYGAYRWSRYDILVLPPSFPYGGMENPRLTFATPTVIVGDRSLVSLVAHELAHSWSGNLVTNSSWKDVWLNEGFTSYVESRLVEALYGRDQADMENVIGEFGLRAEMADMPPTEQVLALASSASRDPDDGPSDVAYVKGAWFLSFLEGRVGREHFDEFLRGYFDHFAFQSIDTDQFVAYAIKNLLQKYPGKVSNAEFNAWLHDPGIPGFATAARSSRFDAIDSARASWLAGTAKAASLASGEWSTQEWVRFLEGMPATLTTAQLAELDAAFHFSGTPNGEIAQRWYPLTVRSGYADARPAIEKFLITIGRRKLIMPTWEALAAKPDDLAFARDVFAKAKPGYHPITTASVIAALDKGDKKSH